jgi:cyclic pyranopterin phosphate synthase
LSVVDTLRVSVTDRCNLRCVYCMPGEGVEKIPAGDILRFEEILRLVRIGAAQGIRKVRITGGEPLVRSGIAGFVSKLSSLEGIVDLCLTTNGVLLKGLARDLKRAGLHRVTISLDSLRRDRFEQITGRDALDLVLDGIEASLAEGLVPVKVNVVVMQGMNEEEIVDFSRLSVSHPLEVRFIERMPFGKREETRGCGLWEGEGLAGEEVLRRIEEALGPLEPASPTVLFPGPARLYRVPGSPGRIGLITPMTHPFCDSCTRLRLTPDGKLRNCLFSDDEIDVRRVLRAGEDHRGVQEAFEEAVRSKPKCDAPDFSDNNKWMVEIGG